ncbi:MAG: hypothetical protein JWL83_3054, partial [Actinomycetia bacterium]|nr:hypothetical protein [Actinomycetes bacterium]
EIWSFTDEFGGWGASQLVMDEAVG